MTRKIRRAIVFSTISITFFSISKEPAKALIHLLANRASHHSEESRTKHQEATINTETNLINTPLDLEAQGVDKPREVIIQERLETLHKACLAFKHLMDPFKWRRMLYIGGELKLAYCALEKVGSATWDSRMYELNMHKQTGTMRGDSHSMRVLEAETNVRFENALDWSYC